MMRYLRFSLFLLATLCLCGELSAQAPEPMSVRFTPLSWERMDSKGLGFESQGTFEPLRISSAYRGGVYTYTGTNPIVFYRSKAMPDGTEARTPIATATIPNGWRDVLLLFIANPQRGEGQAEYRVIVIDDSTSNFPWGSYHIYNLSEYEIGGIFGSEKFTIPGKKSKIVTPDADNKVDVQIHFSQKIDGQWVPRVNTRWLYQSNARSIIFVTDDTQARPPRIKVKSIDQLKVATEP